MNCPKCGAWTSVMESRPAKDKVARRRVCGNGHRFSTYELAAKGTITDGPAPSGKNLMRHGASKSLKLVQEV